jgi:hypothetical protein
MNKTDNRMWLGLEICFFGELFGGTGMGEQIDG